jgi:hypothetical protein
VDVDETGCDVKPRRIGNLAGTRGRDVGGDQRNLVAGDGHIHDGVDAVFRIDDVAVPDQQIECRVLGIQRGGGHRGDGYQTGDSASHSGGSVGCTTAQGPAIE